MVFGLFETYNDADSAVKALQLAGYETHTMNILAKQEALEMHEDTSETAEDAGKGAGIGGVIGLIAGVVPFAIPGIGPIIGTGSLIAGTLTGAGVGAAAGGIVGLFKSMFGDETHAEKIEGALKEGHILVGIEAADSRQEVVTQTMKDYGAYEVHDHQIAQEKATA